MLYLRWIVGIVLIVSGIGSLVTGKFPAGLLLLFCGAALLPPVGERFNLGKTALVAAGVVGVAGLLATVAPASETPDKPTLPPPTEQALREEKERLAESERNEKVNTDIDLCPRKADRAIKAILKDPDSYEAIDHRAGFVGDDGVYISCEVSYRAKNSFGGYNVEKARVDFAENMTPIRVEPIK